MDSVDLNWTDLGNPWFNPRGELELDARPQSACVDVYYIPSTERLDQPQVEMRSPVANRAKLLEVDTENSRLTMFPIVTSANSSEFLKPKYKKIRCITLQHGTRVISDSKDDIGTLEYAQSITFGPTEPFDRLVEEQEIAEAPTSTREIEWILQSLPPGFTKDFNYGLGLAKRYHYIVEAIEDLSDCREMVISKGISTGANEDKGAFHLSIDDFETLRKQIDSRNSLAQAAASSVKLTETYNYLAEKIGKPALPLRFGRHPVRKQLTTYLKSEGEELSEHEQEEVLDTMLKNVTVISETRPDKLARLQADIELVTLEELISRFEKMMTQRHREEDWQRFLDTNPFVLGMAFGYPMVKVREKASVGGRRISGSGNRFTDFLVKNSLTNNTAIIEIKTPETSLLNTKTYRNEIFTPTVDLSGAINQALDQKYRFEQEIAQFKVNSELYDIESYSVHCCLIVGRMPREKSKRRSFEMFRRNSKGVEIVTFDELLEKLRTLKSFLTSSEGGVDAQPDSVDDPFLKIIRGQESTNNEQRRPQLDRELHLGYRR